MRYYATVKGRPEPVLVELETLSTGGFSLKIEGATYALDALSVGNGTWSLRMGHEHFDVELEPAGKELLAKTRGQVVRMDLVDERLHRLRGVAGEDRQGPGRAG
jgi:hypothetical protein